MEKKRVMTRPPTIAELQKEARRVFGQGAVVSAGGSKEWGFFAYAVSKNGNDSVTADVPDARRWLMLCLRALPSHSAPTPKKRKGAKR